MRVEAAQAEKQKQTSIEIGQQFSNFTVVGRITKKRFQCQCICGRLMELTASELLRGNQKSCGCKRISSRAKDIAGMRSGKLVAIEPTEQKRRGCILWRCQCDCGNEFLTEPYKIRSGRVQSCGCGRKQKNMAEIAGQRFGRLVAIRRLEQKRGSNYLWECRCDCGKTIQTTANSLLFGNSKSCGCARVDAVRKTIEKYGNIKEHNHLIDGTSIERLELKGLQANNTSGYTGVQVRGNKYVAGIGFKGKHYYLGIYSNIEDAIQARKRAEKELHGPFLGWYYANYPREEVKRKDDGQGTAQAQPCAAFGDPAGAEQKN